MSDNPSREVLGQTVANSIWQVAPVEEEPVTFLTEWSVRLVSANFDGKGDSYHFVGYAGYEGRVSSPLQNYDKTKSRATSRSGRIYELAGPPGSHCDAEWVWAFYLERNGSPKWKDVTGDHMKVPANPQESEK